MKNPIYLASLFATFVCFWCTLAFGVRSVQLRKPGEPLMPFLLVSPMIYLFCPSRLSSAGLRARKWCFIFASGLAVCVAVDVLLVYTVRL
jgi:hypothetical protein